MRRALASLSLSSALCALWLLSANIASHAVASQTTRLDLDMLGDSPNSSMPEKNVVPLVCNSCHTLVNITHAGAAGTSALAAAFDYLPHALRSRKYILQLCGAEAGRAALEGKIASHGP